MKTLGFWKGFRNKSFPSIFDENLTKRTTRVDDRIMNYLKNGIWLTKLRTIFFCPITEATIDTTVYTDGEWLWSSEYIFYLGKYDIEIPEAFIKYLVKKNFKIPTEKELEEELLDTLEDLATEYTSQNSDSFI